MKLKKLWRFGLILLFLSILSLWFSHNLVQGASKGRVFKDINQIPARKVGLVLGTIKLMNTGKMNSFFKHRIEAAAKLYHAKKIKFILVSGDNHIEGYDEASDMRDELVKLNVPKNKIYLDYAGFRTLDSVVRAKHVFGLNEIIIISQTNHVKRAIYLARKHGLDAIGYEAKRVGGRWGKKDRLREALARVKAVFDVCLGVEPKFYGPKITVR